MGVPVLRSVARVPDIQPRSLGSMIFSPMNRVLEAPSSTSSYPTLLLRKKIPWLFASMGASTSWCTPA